MKAKALLRWLIALCVVAGASSCVDETDSDGDGIPDRSDNCPLVAGDRETGGCPWYMVDACSGAAPYRLEPYRWASTPYFYYSSGLPASWRDVADYAASTWNAVGTRIQIRKYATPIAVGAARDQKSVISRAPLANGVLGTTYVWYATSSGAVTEADIVLNSNEPLVIGASPNAYDVYSVLVHEFGHFCGLGHVSDRSHTMYPSTPRNSVIQRTLCGGDDLGMRRLYP